MTIARGVSAPVSVFCKSLGIRHPILLAPMAEACPPSLSIAVANAGGMGACGALLLTPTKIAEWAAEVRAGGNGAFQMNLWIPGKPPGTRQAGGAEGPGVSRSVGAAGSRGRGCHASSVRGTM